jgi:hypothetical protein
MEEKQIVLWDDLLAFIKAQPDDRPVNMEHFRSGSSCGCVMVHYGKEVLRLEGEFRTTLNCWENNINWHTLAVGVIKEEGIRVSGSLYYRIIEIAKKNGIQEDEISIYKDIKPQ